MYQGRFSFMSMILLTGSLLYDHHDFPQQIPCDITQKSKIISELFIVEQHSNVTGNLTEPFWKVLDSKIPNLRINLFSYEKTRKHNIVLFTVFSKYLFHIVL